MTSPFDMAKIQSSDFIPNVVSCFQDLHKDTELSDVTMVCEEDQQIEAHKIVLTACSPFFNAVLRKNKHPHPLIYMKGVKAKDLSAIVEFLYLGEANIYQEDISGFFALAEELQLKGLTGLQKNTADHWENPIIAPESNQRGETIRTQTKKEMDANTKVTSIEYNGYNMPEHKCEICGEVFSLGLLKRSHVEKEHAKYPPTNDTNLESGVQCTICGMTQPSEEKLKVHKNQHKKYSFPCPTCKRSFKYESSLDTHISIAHIPTVEN